MKEKIITIISKNNLKNKYMNSVQLTCTTSTACRLPMLASSAAARVAVRARARRASVHLPILNQSPSNTVPLGSLRTLPGPEEKYGRRPGVCKASHARSAAHSSVKPGLPPIQAPVRHLPGAAAREERFG